MPISLRGSTARVNLNAAAAASAAYSPLAKSILVCISHANSNTTGTVTCVVTNSVSALTWQRAAFANFSSGQPGGVFIDVAVCPAGITNTVITSTTTNNNSTGSDTRTGNKIWELLGADNVDPIGASNKGASTTNNLTTTGFTNEQSGSWGFCGGTDWAAPSGSIVSSDLTGDAFNNAAILNGFGGFKTLAASGASSTFNLDAPATAAVQWTWASCEIKAALTDTGLFLPF